MYLNIKRQSKRACHVAWSIFADRFALLPGHAVPWGLSSWNNLLDTVRAQTAGPYDRKTGGLDEPDWAPTAIL